MPRCAKKKRYGYVGSGVFSRQYQELNSWIENKVDLLQWSELCRNCKQPRGRHILSGECPLGKRTVWT